MRKIITIIFLFMLSSTASSQTRWMRLHPDVSWNYLKEWEKEHSWLTPAREGKIFFQKHRVGEARTLLEQAVAEGSDDGRLFYELGYCCQAEGDNEKALRYYREALARLARRDPEHLYHFNAEYLIGALCEEKGEDEEALSHYENALKLRPETAILYYRKAYIFHRQGHSDQSLAEIRRVLELTPDSGSALYLAGVLSLERGDLPSARKYLEKAVRNGAEASSAFYCLGAVSSRTGRYEDAIEYYEKALQADPEHREARIALANLFFERDDFSGARKHLEWLVRREPAVARRHYNLGVVYRQLEMDEEAGRELEEARRIDPDLVFLSGYPLEGVAALFTEANQSQAEGDYQRAIILYRQARAEDPLFIPIRYNLALAYAARGERNQAIRQYTRLLRIDPDYGPAHLNLGILAFKKKLRSAAYHLRKYLELKPDSGQADLIKRYLRELRGW